MMKKSEIVLGKMKDDYLSGNLNIGDKLPAERALAEKYKVSRNSIRQALQLMQYHGWIDTKRGGGSIIKSLAVPVNTQVLMEKLSFEEKQVFEMLEIRVALESEAAALAAQRASATDLEKIKSTVLAMMKAGDDFQAGLQADLAFHMYILEASRNHTLLSLVQTIRDELEKTIVATRQERFKSDEGMSGTIAEHKTIYLAIAEKDSEKSKHLMEKHINQVRRELAISGFDSTHHDSR